MATNFDPIDIGIADPKKKAIADGLRELLADTFTLYIKTFSFHWSVVGPTFLQLHLLFQEQYEDLADAVDDIAERVRALGFHPPGSMIEFIRLSAIKDSTGNPPPCTRMVAELAQDQSTIVKFIHELIKKANAADDLPTIDLLTKRSQAHEKTAWKLRATMS